MKKLLILVTFMLCARLGDAQAPAQTPEDAAAHANDQKARAALAAMVEAMGGERWLSLQNSYFEGRVSGFYQGKPTGAIQNYFQWRTPNGQERDEFSKKRDDIVIFSGNECMEATYQGKKALPKEICEDYLRRREHSIDVAIRVWLKDP